MTEHEFKTIMDNLNDVIISYWPCTTCYLFGYVCAPFTLGLSLLCPGKCAGMAEDKAIHFCEQISLKKKYYENNVKFEIKKAFFRSWVEISYPVSLLSTGLLNV